jgi:STIP1 family protein 1
LYGSKNPAAIKTSYYLAQALLHLQCPTEALEVALAAYQQSLETRNPNTEVLSKTILRAKQAIWAAKETSRLRERNQTLKRVEELLEAELKRDMETLEEKLERRQIGEVGFAEDKRILMEEYERQKSNVRSAFAAADAEMKERVIYSSFYRFAGFFRIVTSANCSLRLYPTT